MSSTPSDDSLDLPPDVPDSPDASATPAPPPKPIMLGRFRLLSILGKGAMGKVVRAEDTQLKRHVALKCLPRQKDPRTHHVQQFIREARSAATLEHPAIVHIYEVGEAAGHHYIAMELIEGGDLSSLIKATGPLDLHRACQLAAEAAEGLAYAAQHGITHRDIKPQNLMLTRSGRCKITDFGLARIDDPTDSFAMPNGAVGTPAYMAPEVIQRLPASAKSDVYSLASVLFFLLTGRAPYPSRNRAELLKMQVEAPVPNILDVRPDLPESLAKVLAAALAKNPDDRPTADVFAKQLRAHTIPISSSGSQVLTSATSPFLSTTLPPAAPTPQKSRTLIYALVGSSAALVIMLVVLIVILSNHHQPAPAAATPIPAAPIEPPPAAAPPIAIVPTPTPVIPQPPAPAASAPAPKIPEAAIPSTADLHTADASALLAAAKANHKITLTGTVSDFQLDPTQKIATLSFTDSPDLHITFPGRLYGSMTKKFGGKDGSGLLHKTIRATGTPTLTDPTHATLPLTSSTQIDAITP